MINKEIYNHVWMMMDASNSSGVIHSFSNKVVPYVWEEVKNKDWEGEFNNHPLVIIIADKLLQLARCYVTDSKDGDKISKAYQYVIDVIHS